MHNNFEGSSKIKKTTISRPKNIKLVQVAFYKFMLKKEINQSI